MKLYESKLHVVFRHRPEEFGGVQFLERRHFVLGFCVWRTLLDHEEVPAWAEIQNNTLGSTEWRSKFASVIDAMKKGSS